MTPRRMPRYRPRSTLGFLENPESHARRRRAVQGLYEEVEANNVRLMYMWRKRSRARLRQPLGGRDIEDGPDTKKKKLSKGNLCALILYTYK